MERRCQCCCLSHCGVNFHNIYGTKSVEQYSTIEVAGLELANEMDWDNEKEEIIMEESQLEEDDDTITALIMSVGIDLAYCLVHILKQIEAEKIISLAGSVLAIFQI